MLDVVAVGADGCWAESTRTCYFTQRTSVSGLSATASDIGATRPSAGSRRATRAIPLATGDLLILTRELTPGRPAECDSVGRVLNPATIGCTSSQVFEDARAGERIWIDDGRIGGVIERKEPDRLHVRITHTRARGAKLAADKGINLPDSTLRLAAMTDKDRADLTFVADHADMVALSFVNTVDDVRALRELLAPLGDRQPAIVLKIETKRGFENLPAMLLEAMKAPRCGVRSDHDIRLPLPGRVDGSVAERVMRLARCPVLTVRYPEREFVNPRRPSTARTRKEVRWNHEPAGEDLRARGLAAVRKSQRMGRDLGGSSR